MNSSLSSDLVSHSTEQAMEWEKGWTPFHQGGPARRGYYRVRDTEGRDGIAFMNLNRTWTLLDSFIKKPLSAWREIP